MAQGCDLCAKFALGHVAHFHGRTAKAVVLGLEGRKARLVLPVLRVMLSDEFTDLSLMSGNPTLSQ
eukprot:2766063-Alexandrium_andersonii.AAC.1